MMLWGFHKTNSNTKYKHDYDTLLQNIWGKCLASFKSQLALEPTGVEVDAIHGDSGYTIS